MSARPMSNERSSAPRRLFRLAALAVLVASSFALAACSEVPAGGARAPDEVPMSRRLEPAEIIPADLDVVIRLDLDRMNRGLGAEPGAQVTSRVATDPLVSKALVHAKTVTIGLRASDFLRGDHVIVVETDVSKLALPDDFEPLASKNDKVRVLVKKGDAARTETQAVVILDERAIAFVSPIETDAVLRVLEGGADELRGDPPREGLLSIDMRTHRLDPALERKYPSFARLVRELRRVRGVAEVREDGLGFDVEIIAKSADAADRVARFLEALRAGAKDEGLSGMLARMKVEPLEASVRVQLTVPAAIVLDAIRDEADAGAGLHPAPVEGTTNIQPPAPE